MLYRRTQRGFRLIEHEVYGEDGRIERLVQESSAVGEQDGALEKPGSSFLWVGDKHHLDRYQVAELIAAMSHWLENWNLPSQPR